MSLKDLEMRYGRKCDWPECDDKQSDIRLTYGGKTLYACAFHQQEVEALILLEDQ